MKASLVQFTAGLLWGTVLLFFFDFVFPFLGQFGRHRHVRITPGEQAALKVVLTCFMGSYLLLDRISSLIEVNGRSMQSWPFTLGFFCGTTLFGAAFFQTQWLSWPAIAPLAFLANAGISVALGLTAFLLGLICLTLRAWWTGDWS
jgi:hypothetical protein